MVGSDQRVNGVDAGHAGRAGGNRDGQQASAVKRIGRAAVKAMPEIDEAAAAAFVGDVGDRESDLRTLIAGSGTNNHAELIAVDKWTVRETPVDVVVERYVVVRGESCTNVLEKDK